MQNIGKLQQKIKNVMEITCFLWKADLKGHEPLCENTDML